MQSKKFFSGFAAYTSPVICLMAVVAFGGVAFGKSKNTITPQEICKRLQITEEILVFDSSGDHIVHVHRKVREARGGLGNGKDEKKDKDEVCGRGASTGNSSDSFDGAIFFNHEWSVKTDGTMTVSYEQGSEFVGEGHDAKLKDSTGRKTAAVKDFTPISWVSPLHKAQRVVIRLIPTLVAGDTPRDLGKFPILLENATIYDGAGRLWTINLSADGDFIGVSTLQGGLLLSYQPFTGGKKIGRASGREIKFKNEDGSTVVVKSETAILPGDLAAEVYVMIDPTLRAPHIGSQSVSASDTFKEAFERMQKNRR